MNASHHVAIDQIVVRKVITYTSMMGPSGVRTPFGRQYVVAGVRSKKELDTHHFSFHTAEDSWPPSQPGTKGAVNSAVAGIEGAPLGYPGLESDRYVLAFEVPSPLDSHAPRIKYNRDGEGEQTWEISSEHRNQLAAREPRFELQSLEAPEEISEYEGFSVSLQVRNMTEVAGRVLVAVYWPTPMVADDDTARIVDHEVEADADAALSIDIDSMYHPPEESETGTGPPPETRILSIEGHVTGTREITVNR